MSSFSTGIAELGVIVFEALDWGVPQGMSRQLSGELEALIDMMVSADDQDQEGGDGAPPEPGVVGQVLRQTQELLIRSEHRRSCHLCVLRHGGAPDVPELGEADGVAAVLVPGRHLRLPLSLVPAVCCYLTTLSVDVGDK